MDPWVTSTTPRPPCLPRERGDGPNDPPCLPRERGDGPRFGSVNPESSKPPPRARGWTGGRRLARPAVRASPASAGMDRAGVRSVPARPRLPRERGDGPLGQSSEPRRNEPPPRARGWTEGSRPTEEGRTASPASAGMDRRGASNGACWRCLPRERGDGPPRVILRKDTPRPPPRARGWTPARLRPDLFWRASPASAGMDPSPVRQAGCEQCLPRERGDGPQVSTVPMISPSPPPRARGWTLR